jgi:peptide/nickel transport system permease protein
MTTAAGPLDALAVDARRPANLWRDTFVSILRQRSAIVGLTLLGIVVATALLADILATHPPNQPLIGIEDVARARQAPCIHLLGCPEAQPQHLLGLDGNVRDVWSRLVHGARVSLQVGILTVGLAIIVGTVIGAIAGYAGGSLDNLLMRLMDVVLAFPALILAIAIVTVLGPGLLNAQLAIAIVAIPVYARVIHARIGPVGEGTRLRDRQP